MKRIKSFKQLIVIFLIYLALLIFLLSTNPNNVPIIFLMLPVVLLFLALFLSIKLLLNRFLPKLSPVRVRLYAAYLAGLPSFLILLSSVDQLSWRDVALVLFFTIGLAFYTSRLHISGRRNQ